MDKPLTKWYCDVCGNVIDDVEDAYAIWKSHETLRYHGFKIIHQKKCDLKDHIASNALKEFVGEKGAAYLLSFLSVGPLKHNTENPYRSVSDVDEFVDFFRRCQTPYYEEARRRFGDSDLLENFGDSNEYYPYLPNVLKRIIEEYPKKY